MYRFLKLSRLTADQLENFLKKKVLGRELGELLVYFMVIVYAVVFSYVTILKHDLFRSYAWDFGNYNQALWTTLNGGKLFYFTPELYIIPSGGFFGLHVSPLLFLILPLYAVWQTPETLFALQSFVIALGAVPLYFFTKNSLSNRLSGLVFSAVYLLYPPLHGANWFDFHLQAFLPVFMFSALFYLKKEKWLKHYFFLVLALAIAESVSLVVFFVGLYTLWIFRRNVCAAIKQKNLRDKKVIIPFITMIMAVSWFLAANQVKSTFFPVNPELSSFYEASDFWRVLGVQGDPITAPLQIVLNPLRAFEALTYDAYLKLLFIVFIFGSLLFLPFRSSIVFITLAWLGPALLSNHQSYYILGIHYPLYIIPFAFMAAVEGFKKSVVKSKTGTNMLRNLLIVMVVFLLLASPISPLWITSQEVYVPHFSDYSPLTATPHTAVLQRIVSLVPSNASIVTQNNVFPHFSGRIDAYVLPLPHAMAFSPEKMSLYVTQLLNMSDFALVDTHTDTYGASNLVFERVQALNFGLFAEEDGVFLYKKGYIDDPITTN